MHGRMVRGGHGLLQVSLWPTMSYPCTTCGQPPRERKGAKRKRKGKERRGAHGHMIRGGHVLLQVSLGPTMSYPCTTCGQPPREGKGAKGKRKGKGGGEGKGSRP
jgi:DNA-directed RNA polymerase subunit RPC12/RpoP